MSARQFSLIAATLALAGFGERGAGRGPTPAALAGKVSSAKEGLMEGVVVSAKKVGSTVTVSVATDDKGRFSFPAQARAGPVRDQHPRHRLRPRRPEERRRRRRTDGERRDQACADEEPPQADVQRGMVRELPRHRPAEEGAAQLRELPQPRPHRALAIRRRAVRRVFNRMVGYYPGSTPEHPQRLVGNARRSLGQGPRREGDRGISRLDQFEPGDLVLSAQDAAAPDRPLQPRHHHGIRSAAPADPAA